MSKNQIPIGNRALAEMGSWLSRTSVEHRKVGRFVIGDDPTVKKAAYSVAATPAAQIESWSRLVDPTLMNLLQARARALEIARFKAAAHIRGLIPFPALYSELGVVDVHEGKAQELQERYPDTSPVVMWAFGDAVLHGPIRRFPARYGMRIPLGGMVDTTVGVHDPETDEVHTLAGITAPVIVGHFADLKDGQDNY